MQIIRHPLQLPASHKACVVALGNFDGLHLGHGAILKHTLAAARQLDLPAAVMTFEPHPREYFNPAAPKLRLMRLHEKAAHLKQAGFSLLFIPHFNAALATTSAETFISEILAKRLAARHVVTGENFHFGYQRGGNSALLSKQSTEYGFAYSAIPPVETGGEIISSSAIRAALADGDTNKAAMLIGRPHHISGHVIHGHKRGRALGFPTANLSLNGLFIPRHGVYAVHAAVDNCVLKGVANIGIRPTFGQSMPLLEVHLFDYNESLYGKKLRVALHHFIRDEQKFADISTMKQQLDCDIEQAKSLLSV